MKQAYLSFLIFTTFSCSSSNNDLFVFDPVKLKGEIITMSDIADDVSYIPLDNKYTLGVIYTHRVMNGSIYLSAKDIGVLVFNNKGKEVRKIGVRGNGPGEYNHCLSITVDERTGNVFVLDKGNVKVYSSGGRFIREIRYDGFKDKNIADKIEVFNSFLFISDDIYMGSSKNSWAFFDTLGNLVSIKKNSISRFKSNIGMRCPVYKFEDKLFYFNNYNDTVFCISPDLSYKAAYLFSKGDHKWPQNVEVKTSDQLKSALFKVFRIVNMFETNNFIVLHYGYLDGNAICFIGKKEKKVFLATKEIESEGGARVSASCLLNDLDSGLPLMGYISYYTTDDEEYISTFITPFDLKLYVSGDEFKCAVPKYPEKKEALLKLANSLSETDNPVLMMIRLKK